MDSKSHDIIISRLNGYLENIRVTSGACNSNRCSPPCARMEGMFNDLCSWSHEELEVFQV